MSTNATERHDSNRAELLDIIKLCNQQVLGNPDAIRFAFIALLAGGHLLIEDLPGLGKTTLARTLANSLGLAFKRIQFTTDLLPSDIIGVSIFDPLKRQFEFHQGPVFTSILLADEINRAPPRTQSALLEAMSEQQVSVDGNTYALPEVFFVIATQNPTDLTGTFPLPDSQLDRFTLRISMGYIKPEFEKALLKKKSGMPNAPVLPSINSSNLQQLRTAVGNVHCSDALIDYVMQLLSFSRQFPGIRVGLSPRAGISLLASSKAHAYLDGRDFVTANDVQAVFIEACAHRIHPEQDGNNIELCRQLLRAVKVD